MTKETKKPAVNAAVETNVDNVVDQIKAGNLANAELAKEVQDEIKKEEKEHKVSELKDRINRANFKNFKELLQLRARRREEKATKDALSATKGLVDDLCSGKLTVIEYDKKAREVEDNKRKAFQESAKQYDEEYAELKNKNPHYRCYGWWD